MKPEIHLFIIWQNARNKEKEIIQDIENSFKVLKRIEITWSKRNFSKNISRFYGKNLPKWCHKERECGRRSFVLLIIEDENPKYEYRSTTHGKDIVNVNIFDKKSLYRKWTGGGSKVHATNSTVESDHDLTLLLGVSIYDVRDRLIDLPDHYEGDLAGANGWESLSQMFYVLNHTMNYVVIRNYSYLPDSFKTDEHGDIDLLTDDYKNMQYTLNAKPVYVQKYRVHHAVKIGGKEVRFDFRHIGDGYYDKKWQQHILEHRVLNSHNIYIPEAEDYTYSLTYHALIHKRVMASDYKEKIASLFGTPEDALQELNAFMEKRGYKYTDPSDLSVVFNAYKVNAARSTRRKIKDAYGATKRSLKRMVVRKKNES